MYALHPATYGEGDFAVFYSASEVLLVGENPYNTPYLKKYIRQHRPYEAGFRFLYPPTAAIFFLPLVALPFGAAKLLWAAINTVLFFLIIALVQRIREKRFSIDELIAIVSLFILFFPIFTNNRLGQVNLALASMLALHVYLYTRTRYAASALILASMITLKVFPAVLLLHYIMRRDWKMLLFTISALFGIAALAAVLFSPELFGLYLHRLQHVSTQGIAAQLTDIVSYNNPTLNGTLHRVLIYWFPDTVMHNQYLASSVKIIRVSFMLLVGGGAMILQKRGIIPQLHALTLLISALFFAASEIHAQYFVMLIPSIILLFTDTHKRISTPLVLTAIVVATLLMGISYMRFIPKNMQETALTVIPFGFIGNLLFIAALAYIFSPALKEQMHKAVILFFARYQKQRINK